MHSRVSKNNRSSVKYKSYWIFDYNETDRNNDRLLKVNKLAMHAKRS